MFEEKQRARRNLAILISIALHLTLIYFIATSAIDYLSPKGVVTEIDFSATEISNGTEVVQQKPVKEVVVEKPITPPPAKKETPPTPKEVAPPKPVATEEVVQKEVETVDQSEAPINAAAISKTLPDKEIPEETPEPSPEPEVAENNPRQFLKDDRNEDENTNEQLTNVESTPEAAPQPNLASPNDASSDAEENNTSDKAGDPEEAVSALPSPAGYKDGMKVFIDGQIRPTQQPKFVYPEMSRLIREEGEVQMEAVVGSDGRVEVIRLLKSSGSPRLDDYSLKQAAEQLKFSPTGEKFLFRFGPKYKLKDGPPEFLRSREADKLKKSN